MHALGRCGAIITILLAMPGSIIASANEREMKIQGWIENIRLESGKLEIRAKLDTGAETSSLHAPEYEEFERDDDTWIRYTVKNDGGDKQEFEKLLEHWVRITSASGMDRRPVVKMAVCLGDVLREVEVNLADRSELSYQMLIGRSFMKDHILVDSGNKLTSKPSCDMQSEPVAEDDALPKDEQEFDEGDAEEETG